MPSQASFIGPRPSPVIFLATATTLTMVLASIPAHAVCSNQRNSCAIPDECDLSSGNCLLATMTGPCANNAACLSNICDQVHADATFEICLPGTATGTHCQDDHDCGVDTFKNHAGMVVNEPTGMRCANHVCLDPPGDNCENPPPMMGNNNARCMSGVCSGTNDLAKCTDVQVNNPCAVTADCALGLECSLSNGVCVIPTGNGCTGMTAFECVSGQCGIPGDCICSPNNGHVDNCVVDSDCCPETGETMVCYNGQCSVKPGTTCMTGESCSFASVNCPGGGAPTCPLDSMGEACRTNADCGAGLDCVNIPGTNALQFVCLKQTGQACTLSSDCVTNNCSAGGVCQCNGQSYSDPYGPCLSDGDCCSPNNPAGPEHGTYEYLCSANEFGYPSACMMASSSTTANGVGNGANDPDQTCTNGGSCPHCSFNYECASELCDPVTSNCECSSGPTGICGSPGLCCKNGDTCMGGGYCSP